MLRNLAAALALVLMSQTALGLGLGTLKQSSALNEPFDGRIDILGVTSVYVEAIRVRLADEAQFDRAKVSRDAVLLQLRFKVVSSESGTDYVQITSHEPIREPFLNFLLELNWANGRTVREYTVLLDPPLYDPARRRTAPAPTAGQPTAVPTPAPMPAATPSRPVIATAATAAPMATAAAPSAPSSYSADSTIPVEANDTLWSIASANRPDDSTSVQQMMIALLRANPEAFGDGNINILKRGAILRLPDEGETNAMPQSEALAEVSRQHQLWNEYRDVATETVADAPLGEEPSIEDEPVAESEPTDESEPAADSEPEDAEPAADGEPVAESEATDETAPAVDAEADARLELVAPGDDGEAMGAGAGADGAADITLAREELDAQVQENTELQARIAEANEIIDLMSRQVDIKDDELAALQARLLELGIEAPADGVADAETPIDGETDAAVDDGADDVVDTGAADDAVPVAPSDSPDVDITIGDDADGAPTDSPPADTAPVVDDPEVAMDEGGGAEPDTGGSLLGGLIPQHITNMVPGGAMTILGILGVVLLGAFAALFKLISGRRSADSGRADAIADDDGATALTEGFDEDEPITETRENEAEEFLSEDTTEVARETTAALAETSPDLRIIESTAAELAAEEPEDDPLEEVNVYLAYERFDQAEELVCKVIADHPDEHKYKLRLLEVFYSSNNQAAYEEAAKALHDRVGESDPLWESAVAMWTEMSPTRALFAPGAPAAGIATEQPVHKVVDITAEDEAGASTMTMAPGSDAVLESTQVGLGPPADEKSGGLDFDLGASDGYASGDDIFDLTATTDSLHKDDVGLDFTIDGVAAADSVSTTRADALDVSAPGDLTSTDDDILDRTAPAPAGEHDLLDVTSTGMLTDDHPDDLLNVTSPGLMGRDVLPARDDGGIDFDISDTVAPAFGADTEVSDEDDIFDITAPSPADADASLDFDIRALEDADVEIDADDLTFNISGGLDFDATTSEADGDSLELEIAPEGSLDTPDSVDTVEMEAISALADGDTAEIDTISLDESPASEDDDLEFDLSLQSSELDDLAIGGGTIGGPEPEADNESEIEFDLALEDTTEMESFVIDETLELPKADSGDESLEDLAKSMEESMAGLDLGDDDFDDDDDGGELDLSLADTSGGLDLDFSAVDAGSSTEMSLDFDLADLDLENMDQADTIALDLSGGLETTLDEGSTVVLPVNDTVEMQSRAAEIDTKLNLAKAYIELGDKDGARSILDEVARDGSDSQQSEAQRLIAQLT